MTHNAECRVHNAQSTTHDAQCALRGCLQARPKVVLRVRRAPVILLQSSSGRPRLRARARRGSEQATGSAVLCAPATLRARNSHRRTQSLTRSKPQICQCRCTAAQQHTCFRRMPPTTRLAAASLLPRCCLAQLAGDAPRRRETAHAWRFLQLRPAFLPVWRLLGRRSRPERQARGVVS